MGLTKEEKKAKKEQKRLEKLAAEIELKKRLRREGLEREITAQKKKRAELDTSWRTMMLKIKEPVFHQDMEVMWHVFERVYDKKDYLIKHTLNLIETADDQFQRTIAGFCDIIDAMIKKFLTDLEDMAKDNDRRTAAIRKWGEDILAKIMSDHNAAELHLQVMIFHAHTSTDQHIWNMRGETMVKEDEERMRCLNEREELRSFLENNYNTMWDEYKTTLRNYVLGTADNQKQLRRLRRKENVMADIIASQAKKIANSENVHKRLRLELQAYETGEKQAVFRDRRRRHREAYARLKNSLIDGCSSDGRTMALLVNVTNDALEWLKATHDKGERILRVAAMCRKLETRREKVLPFGCDMPHEPLVDPNAPKKGKQRLQQTDSNDSLINDALAATGSLTRLWHRISKVELTRRALVREKEVLENENRVLMMHIEEYNARSPLPGLDGTNVCICGKPDKKMIRHPVAIDGRLDLAKYKKQWW